MSRTLALTLCALPLLALTSCKDNTSTAQSLPHSAAHTAVSLIQLDETAQLADQAYTHTAKILSFGHRQPESNGLRSTKDYIISQLKNQGWSCVEQKFSAKTPKGEMQFSNLIARYAPNSSQNPWTRSPEAVLAAHIDSKIQPNFLGADDAASCAGGLLAIATHLHKKHPESAKRIELVFFDGEEAIGPRMSFMGDGLYGSIHYARSIQYNSAEKLAPYKQAPKFGIVLDMIGHRDLKINIPSDTPKHLATTYRQTAKKLSYSKHFTQSNQPILDDHVPMNIIAKIPTIDLIGDFQQNSWWHTSNDSLEIISKDSLSMSLHVALEILSNHL